MRVLILSQSIKKREEIPFTPPYDIQIDYCDFTYSTNKLHSLFDYDVVILHFAKPRTLWGYREHLSTIIHDITIGLKNGLICILLPETTGNIAGDGEPPYNIFEWLSDYGIELHDNLGTNIKPTGSGRTKELSEYLKYCPKYYQIITKPESSNETRLASVGDTDILVGIELKKDRGYFVILPPLKYDDNSFIPAMYTFVDVMKYYQEKAQRNIELTDAPEWIQEFRINKANLINSQIAEFTNIRNYYQKIEYILYGTGEELEYSVMEVFCKLGFQVFKQKRGSNIDLLCSNDKIKFAIEVTGTKGTIKKESKKIAQSWEYLYSEDKTKLLIVANTECHLSPNERKQDAFSKNVVELLSKYDILLITTIQLYNLWKKVEEGTATVESIEEIIMRETGILKN